MDRLLEKSVFVDHPSCADARSAVLASADLDHAIENTAAEAAVLDKAIKDVQQRLGGPKSLDLTKDRNLADNLRVFLDRAGRTEALDQLYPKLIAAYPDDYVYPYRFGRSLAARGRDEDALPYLEQAAGRAYGVNRLNVAQLRAEVLLRLNRPDDARAMVAETLRANGPWFPQQAARLKALVASL
jgi:predicted Zn-dependent protease